jgi:SAM-dependent methyltransferase
MAQGLSTDSVALNARSWDYANHAFNQRKGDYVAAMGRGEEVVPPELFAELGPNGTDHILHLMCNDGREAAYISRISGARFDGVDFSAEAIDYARNLNTELGLSNRFTTDDVLYLLNQPAPDTSYTKVLMTLGSLRWVADIPSLLRGIHNRVAAGGLVVVWDFHPVVACLGADARWTRDYPLKSYTYHRSFGVVDYTGDPSAYRMVARNTAADSAYDNPHRVYFSEHPLSSIITAITSDSHYSLVRLREYFFSWEERCLPWLVEDRPRRWISPRGMPAIPLTFVATFRAHE